MTHAREMLDTYPGAVAIMDADALIECIEACFDCSQSCSACADACLGEEMVGHLRRCITMCLNCSDECATTGRLLSRQTDFESAMARAALQACAEACRLCAEECEHHATEMNWSTAGCAPRPVDAASGRATRHSLPSARKNVRFLDSLSAHSGA
jgi:hypothetical protein